ncbi:phage baseplate protein [Clostridium sp.]|uniref:phage baseplate protein n=1 Tax=Clostridium sp. TaxID=1506 RepID=UPI0026169BFA|nr:hypothetical protein [Clostridium sp.]
MQELLQTYFITSNGNYMFDAYFNINHESNLTITEHPVQTGANIADHAYMEPNTVTFEIGMSDAMQDSTDSRFKKFTDDTTRSITAYRVLRQLQAERLPIQVINKLNNYRNMLIETISATEDNKTTNGLRATVTLKELLVANVTTVKLSARPQKSSETNEGDQKPQEADQSLLVSIFGG